MAAEDFKRELTIALSTGMKGSTGRSERGARDETAKIANSRLKRMVRFG